MKRSSIRSPYLWAIVGIATVIVIAWVGRENYRPVITGTAAPEFKALTLDGSETTLSDFRDKVLLLNIWATWCVPCLQTDVFWGLAWVIWVYSTENPTLLGSRHRTN